MEEVEVRAAVIATKNLDRVSDFYAFVFDGERRDGCVPPGAPRTAMLQLGDAATELTIVERTGRGRVCPIVVEVEDHAALARVHRRLMCFVAADSSIQRDDQKCWVRFHDPDGPALALLTKPGTRT